MRPCSSPPFPATSGLLLSGGTPGGTNAWSKLRDVERDSDSRTGRGVPDVSAYGTTRARLQCGLPPGPRLTGGGAELPRLDGQPDSRVDGAARQRDGARQGRGQAAPPLLGNVHQAGRRGRLRRWRKLHDEGHLLPQVVGAVEREPARQGVGEIHRLLEVRGRHLREGDEPLLGEPIAHRQPRGEAQRELTSVEVVPVRVLDADDHGRRLGRGRRLLSLPQAARHDQRRHAHRPAELGGDAHALPGDPRVRRAEDPEAGHCRRQPEEDEQGVVEGQPARFRLGRWDIGHEEQRGENHGDPGGGDGCVRPRGERVAASGHRGHRVEFPRR